MRGGRSFGSVGGVVVDYYLDLICVLGKSRGRLAR